ncbi:MAG: hypothetical protein MUF22_02130 [Chitinispirillaceae bacterium]|nr:hypothetical protein [Chitinispirillaceae bacterium]
MFSFNKILALFIMVSCFSVAVRAEQAPDSSAVYKEIETYSKKNKFSRFMYGLVFKPTRKSKRPKPAHLSYKKYEGRIIRSINIITVDPFGYSISDTTAAPDNIVYKSGNALHIKTHRFTIRNLLLVRENDFFDSLLVKESERLVRGQNYVQEVLFSVVPVTADSVDLYVRVADKWSVIPKGHASAESLTAGFTEKNFAGLGHSFSGDHTWDHTNGRTALTTDYYIPNIRRTHVQTVLHYDIDEQDNSNTKLEIERPFFSPFAQWAAGIISAQTFQKDTTADTTPGLARQDLKFNTQDYWAGKAFRIFNGNTEDERTTNAIVSGRYLRVRYRDKPDFMHDSLHQYADEDFYLGGLGISTRRYFQDHFIFNSGVIEDVPVGKAYGITGGYQTRSNEGRWYLGARTSFGDYYDWGYLSGEFEYGTFIHGSRLEQGVISAGANYFSHLFEIGDWRIRQFLKPQVTWGTKRFAYDSLTINDENGIRGFSGSSLGTKKILLTLQTQSYAPWNVFGFRFGPFLVCTLGKLGNQISGFVDSPVYSQLGIGTLIHNNFLVSSSFQLSVAYYPLIPGTGYNVFKLNSFVTTDFGFRDFAIGKPDPVAFQ